MAELKIVQVASFDDNTMRPKVVLASNGKMYEYLNTNFTTAWVELPVELLPPEPDTYLCISVWPPESGIRNRDGRNVTTSCHKTWHDADEARKKILVEGFDNSSYFPIHSFVTKKENN